MKDWIIIGNYEINYKTAEKLLNDFSNDSFDEIISNNDSD